MTISDRGRFFFPLNIHEHLLRSSFIRDQGSYHLLYKKKIHIQSLHHGMTKTCCPSQIFFFVFRNCKEKRLWQNTAVGKLPPLTVNNATAANSKGSDKRARSKRCVKNVNYKHNETFIQCHVPPSSPSPSSPTPVTSGGIFSSVES